MAWWNRFANLFRPAKVRDEIDEELRYHISARIADNIATGMSAKEARADALRRFGGATVALEKSHDADIFVWLETIVQDVRYGARNLRSNPGVTAVALLSLALGTGAGTAIFSVVNAVLLRTLPYQSPDRIAVVWVTSSLNGSREMNASIPNLADWGRRAHSFSDLASYREADASFFVNGEPDWIEYTFVYGDFFRLMGRSPALGRLFNADDAREVVLSHRFWRSRFGGSRGSSERSPTPGAAIAQGWQDPLTAATYDRYRCKSSVR